MVKAAALSERLTGFDAAGTRRIIHILDAVGLPTHRVFDASWRSKLKGAMALDKKVADGVVQFVLATRLGAVVFGEPAPSEVLEQVLEQDQSES
jgi:3-dehydroquinate synthetase